MDLSWKRRVSKIRNKNIDVLFNGYAFDYLLGDNYLPRTPVLVFDKYSTLINKYIKRKTDIVDFFLNTISWRYKTTPAELLFKNRKPLDFVVNELSNEVNIAKTYSGNPMDHYLFLTIHNLSRHSMYIESSLIRPYLEERTPGLDKDLFDFSLKIPYPYKLNYKLYKKAISLIDWRYLDLINANTNYKSKYNPYYATLLLFINKIKKKIGLSNILPPSANDRSWGDARFVYENNKELRNVLSSYKTFILWKFLDELNSKYISEQLEGYLSGKNINRILVNHVLVIETLLRDKLL